MTGWSTDHQFFVDDRGRVYGPEHEPTWVWEGPNATEIRLADGRVDVSQGLRTAPVSPKTDAEADQCRFGL